MEPDENLDKDPAPEGEPALIERADQWAASSFRANLRKTVIALGASQLEVVQGNLDLTSSAADFASINVVATVLRGTGHVLFSCALLSYDIAAALTAEIFDEFNQKTRDASSSWPALPVAQDGEDRFALECCDRWLWLTGAEDTPATSISTRPEIATAVQLYVNAFDGLIVDPVSVALTAYVGPSPLADDDDTRTLTVATECRGADDDGQEICERVTTELVVEVDDLFLLIAVLRLLAYDPPEQTFCLLNESCATPEQFAAAVAKFHAADQAQKTATTAPDSLSPADSNVPLPNKPKKTLH